MNAMTADFPSGRSPAASEVAHLGHVELLTPRPEDSLRCFVDVLGLREAHRAGDSVYLRGESEYERYGLKLTASRDAGVGHVGLRAASAAALDRRVAALQAAGVTGVWIEDEIGHGPAFRFTSPGGHAVELYWETERQEPEPGDPPLPRDRLGRRQLGFSLYDEVRDDDGLTSAAWLSAGQRPLELVFTRDRSAAHGRLHHVAFWVDTREEVLRAADIFADHGVRIEVPPAQHTIGRSFFLYGFEPGGNRIEISTGADLVLDPDPPTRIWTAAERRRGIGWGTVFPPTWYAYGTPDVDG